MTNNWLNTGTWNWRRDYDRIIHVEIEDIDRTYYCRIYSGSTLIESNTFDSIDVAKKWCDNWYKKSNNK